MRMRALDREGLRARLSWVLAATVMSQGLGCATVLASGPELPAEAATNTPAAAAPKNAYSTASTVVVVEPEIEKLMTLTPSMVRYSTLT